MSTTEELKREMYKSLANLKGRIEIHYSIKDALHGVDDLESTIEDYLEALRQDRDTLRNKLQAFEFANQSTSELLRDALTTVKRQREFIRTLYTSRKARKPKQATRTQSSTENASDVKCEAPERNMTCSFKGLHKHYIGACPHCGGGPL